MTKSIQYRSGRHCVFKLHCHLVFVTKYRFDVLQEIAGQAGAESPIDSLVAPVSNLAAGD